MSSAGIRIHSGDVEQLPGTIRFVCISDTHDCLQNMNIPEGDVLLHAGDFSRRGTHEEVTRFNEILSRMPHPTKIVIAGNHELTFDIQNQARIKSKFKEIAASSFEEIKYILRDCIYLEDASCEVGGYNIYGSPWTLSHGNMAFNLHSHEIFQKWRAIPENTDILITHGPPYGILDTNKMGESCGCKHLLDKVQQIKPLFHIFGHIHEGHGVTYGDETIFMNASSCLNHRAHFTPMVFDLPIPST